MNIVDHTSSILRMFDIEPKPLDRIVDIYFTKHPKLGKRERGLIADAAFGVMRWRRRIDAILRERGVARPAHRDRVAMLQDGVERIEREEFPGSDAEYYSFPDFLYGKLAVQYGDGQAARIAGALDREQRPTVRVNTMKATREEAIRNLVDLGAEPTRLSPFGIRLAERAALGNNSLYVEGAIEIQDESSQLAVMLAAPKPGEKVLDACAGAGGKTLMIAMLMEDEGRIVASDVNVKKLAELRRRAKRAGTKIVETIRSDDIESKYGEAVFDLVFVDAPCSGTGTIRRSPDIKWRIDTDYVDARVREQRELIKEYSRFVRPGGRLVFATCSILREEGEDVVESFLRKSDFDLSEEDALRTDPSEGEWDGFFAAKLVRAQKS